MGGISVDRCGGACWRWLAGEGRWSLMLNVVRAAIGSMRIAVGDVVFVWYTSCRILSWRVDVCL